MNSINARIKVIMVIGLAAFLSIAVVLATVAISRGHVVTRDVSEEEEEPDCVFKKGEVIKTLKKICERKFSLDVKYATTDVTCGAEMTMQTTETSPEVAFPEAEEGKRYSLLMLDPDAGSSSVADLNFYLHWAVTDMQVQDLKTGTIIGKELMKYTKPNPPEKDGFHRYQFVLFTTSDSGEVTLSGSERGDFSLDEFAEKNDVCDLVSAFEFKTKKVSLN